MSRIKLRWEQNDDGYWVGYWPGTSHVSISAIFHKQRKDWSFRDFSGQGNTVIIRAIKDVEAGKEMAERHLFAMRVPGNQYDSTHEEYSLVLEQVRYRIQILKDGGWFTHPVIHLSYNNAFIDMKEFSEKEGLPTRIIVVKKQVGGHHGIIHDEVFGT